jgi:cobalt-zinc-cadmium efflux system outer membrane protein
VAERRLEVGDGSRLELNAARVEIGRAAREAALARQALEVARSELRLLAALPSGAALELQGELGAAAATALDGALAERAIGMRADLAAARRELEAAEAEERLASREWLPSPRLGVTYAREESADIVLGSLAFDLPVWNRNVAARGGSEARASRARSELDATERRVREEVLLAVERLETAREALRAFDDEIVTATGENLALTTQAYESGKLELVEMLLIRRSAIDARRGHVEALTAVAEAEAELQRASGVVPE